MKRALNFDHDAIDLAIDAVDLITVTSGATVLLHELAAWLAPVLGMGELRAKGLVWIALQRWQIDHQQPAQAILNFPPSVRIEAIRSVIDHLGSMLELWIEGDQTEKLRLLLEQGFSEYRNSFQPSL